MSKQVTCNFVKITPKVAQQYLDCAGRNRKIREARVDLYAQQIKRGDWLVTNQGIAFDETGKLIDGQHRLMAIVRADTSAEILVVRGLKIGAQLVLDQPAARQIHDQIRLDRGLDVTSRDVAVAKQMMISVRPHIDRGVLLNLRDTILIERFYMRHHVAISYVTNLFKKAVPGITLASIMAVMSRAYYSLDEHERLNEFADVLTSGFTETRTASAAIALRNYLLSVAGRMSSRKVTSRIEIYKKTELALESFLKREPTLRLPRTDLKTELFPLPEETAKRQVFEAVVAPEKPRLIKKSASAAVAAI